MTAPTEGARVRLARTVDRGPHFIAAAGATGTLTEYSVDLVAVRMDAHLPGAEEWDNEVCWTPEDGYPGPQDDARTAAARDLEAIE